MNAAGLPKSNSHYDVLSLIGQGGMGRVYKARDRRLDRLVALKFLAGGLLDSDGAREAFHREAQAIAALNHPNIAVLYDVGESDGTPFLALEYLSGGSLERRGASRLLPMAEILEYALQLASGLSHAHGHGIVHRDVKPSNALFAETGVLKLVDFGLAQWRGGPGAIPHTSPGGTPQYMAPEVLAGRDADQRCDVFAFGVLLYRLAAGCLPFDGATLQEVIRRISHERPRPLETIRPDLPKAYAALVDECLRKDPSQRPASMALIRHELEKLEPSDPVNAVTLGQPWDNPTLPDEPAAAPPPAPHQTKAAIPQHWRVSAAVALVLLAIVSVRILIRSRPVPAFVGGERLVVVLPFDCPIADPAAAGFCSGLHADLLPRLNQSRQFQTDFWTISAAELATQGIRTALEAGTRLRADLAIQGVVTFSGGEYRVHLDLTNAHDARLLRSRVVSSRDTLALPGVLFAAAVELLETRIAAAGAFVLSAAPTTVPESFQLLVQAQGILLEYGGLETIRKADALLTRAIALDPANARAHALISQAWQQEFTRARDPASLRRAAQAAADAYRLNPEDLEVLLSYGRVQRRKGDYSGAIDTFNKAAVINPTDPEVFRLLALSYADNRQAREALNSYQRAIEVNPRWSPAWHNRATYWFSKGETARAVSDLETALKLSPGNADVLRDLGIYYEKAGRVAEAEDCLRRSLDLRTTHHALAALAYIRERQRRYEEAAGILQQAAAMGSKDHLVFYNLASNWSMVPGKEDAARQACDGAVELITLLLKETPRDAEARARLAVCRARLGQPSEAQSAIRAALRLQPDSVSVLKKAALVASIQKNDIDAAALLVQAVKAGEDPAEILRDGSFERILANPALRQRLGSTQKPGK